MFRGIVKSTGYPLHSPVSPSLPLPCVAVCPHYTTGVYRETLCHFGRKKKTWCGVCDCVKPVVDCVWNVMAHAQKPDFVFRRNGRVHLVQFIRLLAAEVCAPAVVMLDTPCSEVVWRVLGTHSIRKFPLHFPSRASPCVITFQMESTVKPYVRRRPALNLYTAWRGAPFAIVLNL
jgi:hypothetical protein